MSICRNEADFFARQDDLTQESFVDFKENQRSIAEKDASCGGLHMVRKRPNNYQGLTPPVSSDTEARP